MICPKCNSENTKVYDTRQFPSYRWRRYKCLECGERFTTKEAINSVPVVRCKDCCHCRKATNWDGSTFLGCHLRADVIILKRKPDDFCSRGEPREGST